MMILLTCLSDLTVKEWLDLYDRFGLLFLNQQPMKNEFIQTIVSETGNSTLSVLHFNKRFIGFIIEDGHRNVKVYGETRIPAGTYQIERRTIGTHYEKYKKRYGHEFSIQLLGVPGFTNILIHIGNYVKDTEGCLLINKQAALDEENDVFRGFQSTVAYKEFYELIDELFKAEINPVYTIVRDYAYDIINDQA